MQTRKPLAVVGRKVYYCLEDRPHWSDVLRELEEHPSQAAKADRSVHLSKKQHEQKLRAWKR